MAKKNLQKNSDAKTKSIPITSNQEAKEPAASTKTIEGASSKASLEYSAEDRMSKIQETAYFLAEQRGFQPGMEIDDWLQAEQLIDKQPSPG